MSLKYDKLSAQGSPDKNLRTAEELAHLMGTVFTDLVLKNPAIGITNEQVRTVFGSQGSLSGQKGYEHAAGALSGIVRNRLGGRSAQLYVAKEGDDIIGWLTTAADYSNRPLRKFYKSYLWLVNGGVHPERQRHGVMKELLHKALTDKAGPSTASLHTYVSAYPFVLPPNAEGVLPAVEALHRIGILPTDEAFEDNTFFDASVWMQRHQGDTPEQVAAKL